MVILHVTNLIHTTLHLSIHTIIFTDAQQEEFRDFQASKNCCAFQKYSILETKRPTTWIGGYPQQYATILWVKSGTTLVVSTNHIHTMVALTHMHQKWLPLSLGKEVPIVKLIGKALQMNALKCNTLGTCVTECACTYQWRGKWQICVVAVQCWKDSGSATEQFQRKSHKISHLYHALGKLCHS